MVSRKTAGEITESRRGSKATVMESGDLIVGLVPRIRQTADIVKRVDLGRASRCRNLDMVAGRCSSGRGDPSKAAAAHSFGAMARSSRRSRRRCRS